MSRRTLTIPEAAEMLGISRNSAYLAAQRGELPTIRLGRRFVVPVSALERLLGGSLAPEPVAAGEGRGAL